MTETLKDMMTARADAAPGPHLDVGDVIRAGRRRVLRNRAAGGTAACAVLAAVALIAPTHPFGGADPSAVDSADRVTYAVGSTIHDGNRTIDVAPHEVTSYVRTDDGFAYAAQDGRIYFTDGGASEQIGDSGGDHRLAADDSGSYVGWTEVDGYGDQRPEVVVYDTARRTEVFRTSAAGGDGRLPPLVMAIDDGVVYVRDDLKPYTAAAWDVSTSDPVPSSLALTDVANGYIARDYWRDNAQNPRTATIVSRDPDSDQPRFPRLDGISNSLSDLSPSGRYILSDVGEPSGFRQVVVERATKTEVTPRVVGYAHEDPAYWIDDDRYVLEGYTGINDGMSKRDLLVCSVSAGSCEVVTTLEGGVTFPDD
jgi:hypothetical protein